MTKVTGKNRIRIVYAFMIICALILMLVFRLAWVQIVKADEYSEKAVNQQTRDIPIDAKRGSILDTNGKELATSATCYTLWAHPADIKNNYSDKKIGEISTKLAVILEKDASEIESMLTKKQALTKIDKYLSRDTADKIREMEVYGLELAENKKRYYPLGNFASQLLGSVNDDGQGIVGVELQYDEYLSGVAGRWIKNTDLNGNTLVNGSEAYYQAEDGLNVVLTVDEVLQHYAENAIAKGIKKTNASRVWCLVMDPKTGDVLAMAANPGFDPNTPYEPADKTALELFNEMSDEEQSSYLSKMWRNPIVSDTYEPGSTFKLITTSSALEEGVATMNSNFYCNVGYTIPGTNVTLHCWSPVPHGNETLKVAVGNSCNPVQMQLALSMGKDTYYDYLNMFGITAKTGIDLPAESKAIIQNKNKIGPVELATMSYGQGIAVTPIQLVTAVCAIGNDGVLMEPRVVKELRDKNGKAVKTFETRELKKIISSKTASEMKEIMEYVVAEGGGGNAQVPGYRIGGKTGTADKAANGTYSDDTYSSFIGMAPMDDPKFVILVVVDSPKGVQFGSATAAPIAKDFLENALPYMGVSPNYTDEESEELATGFVYVPDVTGKSYSDAIGILGRYNLKYKATPSSSSKRDFKVVDQYPKAGSKLSKGGKVYLYRE